MQIIADYAPSVRVNGIPIDPSTLDATAGYLRHYANLLTLTFFHRYGTMQEKQQAAEELQVCERRMKWWANLPRYDHQEALRGIAQLKAQWGDRLAS